MFTLEPRCKLAAWSGLVAQQSLFYSRVMWHADQPAFPMMSLSNDEPEKGFRSSITHLTSANKFIQLPIF